MKRRMTVIGQRGKDRTRAAGVWAATLVAGALLASNLTGAQGFRLLEATVDDVHAAFASGELTCRALVQGCLSVRRRAACRGPRRAG